jgi:thiol-disulfide isomerase/thioredoxin
VKRLVGTLALAAVVAMSACSAAAQEAVLTLTAEPAMLDVAPGGTAAGRVVARNASPYEADEIEFAWKGTADLALDPTPEPVAVLGAYASTLVLFTIAAARTAPPGETRGDLEVIYSYCIDDLCYQIVELVPISVRVTESAPTPSDSVGGTTAAAAPRSSGSFPWQWLAFALAALLLVPAAWARKSPRARVALIALLVLASGATLGLGVSLAQHTQAQAVGAVLCTSCVGIETVETKAPRLTTAQAAAVDRLSKPVSLLVFYAPWCRSCPYAEGLVDLVAQRNSLVEYQLVNAEVERGLAATYGVTRTGRTVVPAVVRIDTGTVLFGAEDLGDRLIALLEEGT